MAFSSEVLGLGFIYGFGFVFFGLRVLGFRVLDWPYRGFKFSTHLASPSSNAQVVLFFANLKHT